MLKKESKYSFLYRAHDRSIMRPENFLNINGGRTLSSSQLRALRITKIKNTSFKRQAIDTIGWYKKLWKLKKLKK